jgi:(p)ppGpp synthase/HD superfamily hydrolase
MLLKELENKLELILKDLDNDNERDKLREAYLFAKGAHEGQIRKS